MTKTKKNALSTKDAGAASAAAPIVPSRSTPKSENSKNSKVSPTKANATSVTSPASKTPRATSATKVTKANKPDAKDKMAVAKKTDATRPAKSAKAEPTHARTTKQEQVLTMLTKSGGVTIDEMMGVTGWQQHSVRGFLAGTVRKKLGLDIASVKAEGSERRYSIKTKPNQGR
jgi:hypothetical protein